MRLTNLALTLALAAVTNAWSQTESHPDPTWKDEIAKGIVPYHQLTLDDFHINDTASLQHEFYVWGAIDPQCRLIMKSANGFQYAYIDRLMVFSGLDKQKTYRKSRFRWMKRALPYAQAILDLNEICARHLAATKPGELPSGRGNSFEEAQAELSRKFKEFVEAKYKECDIEMQAFSKATAGGTNAKKVRELAAEIKKRLEATPNATVPFTDATVPPGSLPSPPVPTPNESPAANRKPKPSPLPTVPK